MKIPRFFFVSLFLGVQIYGGTNYAEESKPSPELIAKGEELFTKKELLGVKYACIMCHKQEKAIQRAKVDLAGDKLPDVINKYILEKAKGKPLSKDSEEIKALVAFIKYKHSI